MLTVYDAYKYMGSKVDLAVKKVKRQFTNIILATLVDLASLMICTKIQPQGIICSGEEDF